MTLDLDAIKAKIDSRNANTTLGDFFHDLLELVAEVERLCDEEADGIQAEMQAEVESLRGQLAEMVTEGEA